MAATPKGAQKMKFDFSIDKQAYDDFVRACSRKGYAPQIVIEKLIKKYNETGQL